MNAPMSPEVLAHFQRPQGAGCPQSGDSWISAAAGTVAAGAYLQLWLRLEAQAIADVAFEAFGCPALIACGSWLASELPGWPESRAQALRGADIAAALQLVAGKHGMALLAEDALKEALREARGAGNGEE